MNLVLLGNGFDLSLGLPTSYIDFLDTMDFILASESDSCKTVADIWCSKQLRKRNKNIANAYDKYKAIYENIPFPEGVIAAIKSTLEKNSWYRYLTGSFNKDAGWIDFEQEIQSVMESFSFVLISCEGQLSISISGHFQKDFYIVHSFNFLLECEKQEKNNIFEEIYSVKREFTIERPLGSGHRVIDKEKIIAYLYDELRSFTSLLQKYLDVFIDAPFAEAVKQKMIGSHKLFGYTERVITLNYTHSFECLYPTIDVIHLHGEVGKKIILGIPSDVCDNEEFPNTDFIMFKKYFQRLVYGTDKEYLYTLLEELQDSPEKISLAVMGHSLDVSDRDIIVELFNASDSITILYHSQGALETYVRNLVRIFGKQGLDELRATKSLKFHPLAEEQSFTVEQGMEDFCTSFEAK